MSAIPTPLTEVELAEMLNCDGIGGDEEFLIDIIQMAIESSKEKLAEIDKEGAADNHEAIWRLAHAIKSTCLMANMKSFGQASINVERAFRRPEGDDEARRQQYLQELHFQAARLYLTGQELAKRSA